MQAEAHPMTAGAAAEAVAEAWHRLTVTAGTDAEALQAAADCARAVTSAQLEQLLSRKLWEPHCAFCPHKAAGLCMQAWVHVLPFRERGGGSFCVASEICPAVTVALAHWLVDDKVEFVLSAGGGISSMESSGLLDRITGAWADAGKPLAREGAMLAFGALVKQLGEAA